MAEPKIVTLPDPEALARHVAGWLTDLAIASTGRFAISLSGGSTPKRLYEILAEPDYAHRFPWDRTHLFWGDERFVPPDSPDSNLGMTRRALLDHVPIPPANIHPMPTTGSPADAARAYEATLKAYYGLETLDMARPLFDVTLLGLGENGHTASLFPNTASLDETLAWVAPVTEGVPQPRLTLTYPAIACTNQVAFLIAGKSKKDVLTHVLAGDRSQPAARITAAGDLIWFTDAAAVGGVMMGGVSGVARLGQGLCPWTPLGGDPPDPRDLKARQGGGVQRSLSTRPFRPLLALPSNNGSPGGLPLVGVQGAKPPGLASPHPARLPLPTPPKEPHR